MQYKLIDGSLNDTSRVVDTILLNRQVDPNEYLYLEANSVENYELLDNIDKAVGCFAEHFANHETISILYDSDVDGVTSAAIVYKYIKGMDKDYPVKIIVHERNKSHGVADMDFAIPDDTKLLILPDSSTNDSMACNQLIADGIDIIILDHHLADDIAWKNKAIIVNNQISKEYKNKNLSGVGVAYQFLKALDEYYWQYDADDYLDLVALGNIADVMDLRSYETRYLVDCGLNNIKNRMFQELIVAQSFSMGGLISIHNIAWYCVPIINALIRVGTFEERELLIRAFVDDYVEFEYRKRNGEVVTETIYERVARLCKNAKSRQDTQRDKLLASLLEQANTEDKVCIFEVDDANEGIVGLAANKLADMIQRPCVVVKAVESHGTTTLKGSARNFSHSPIENLKDELIDSGEFLMCAGHSSAFGVSLDPENVKHARVTLNRLLADVVYDTTFMCDFVIPADKMEPGFVFEIDGCKFLWCTGIEEPMIAVEYLNVSKKDIRLQGKLFDSITFESNGVKYVQFKCTDEDPIYKFAVEDGNDDDVLTVTVVGHVSVNEFRGEYTPQMMIEGVEVEEENRVCSD